MTQYVALLRGIAPMNPAMRNENLRRVFESLGLAGVRTVISSGNVIFETSRRDADALASEIEQALHDQLGFWSTTILRSRAELEDLAAADPFAGQEHSRKTYLTVTFTKHALPPHAAADPAPGASIAAVRKRELCAIVDTTVAHVPGQMAQAEKQLGKEITTRTWKTVHRILQKMAA